MHGDGRGVGGDVVDTEVTYAFASGPKWVLSRRALDLATAEVCRMEVQETAGAEAVRADAG